MYWSSTGITVKAEAKIPLDMLLLKAKLKLLYYRTLYASHMLITNTQLIPRIGTSHEEYRYNMNHLWIYAHNLHALPIHMDPPT